MKGLRFVDWQLCKFNSPIVDIFNIIFSSTTKPIRDSHYVNLLNHYHKTISETIIKLGSDPEKLFSFTDFQNQLKKFGKFSFMLAALWTQINLVDSKDLPDLDELAEGLANNKKEAKFVTGYDHNTQLEYNRRINDLYGDLIDFGYYWK